MSKLKIGLMLAGTVAVVGITTLANMKCWEIYSDYRKRNIDLANQIADKEEELKRQA